MKNRPKFLPRLAAGLFTLTAGTLPALTLLSLAPTVARAQQDPPAAQEVSFDFFYNNLADNGDWYNTPDFGYVFQPYIAYKNEQWRPYTDGYWAQTDQGWTWVSYEDFGWACYHYGRWSQLDNVGWVWVPGYEWAPGWVSWRTSDDYVGWAPLPPKRTRQVAATTVERTGGVAVEEEPARPPGGDRVYQGQLVRPEDVEEDYDNGYNAAVDAQYDIGPSQYSFVPVQSFGAPYLVEAIVPPAQNVVIIEGTTNVTNIVYRRGGPRDGRLLYCGGPDYAYLSRRVERPIPRLLLERRTDVAADRASLRADQFNVVRDNRLEIVAPFIARRPVNFAQMHPERVKETLVRPQVNHGWRNVQQQDPRLAERLRERFQQQARQAPPARQVAENYLTPAAFRAQPPPTIQEQQRLHQPPPPRTAEGNRVGGFSPPQPPAGAPPATLAGPQPGGPVARGVQPPPRPTGNPEVQPVPGPNGRNLTETERQARRDARRRETEQRQPGSRPPTTAPNAAIPGNGNVPPAPGQPAPRPNRTAEEREAYRASKQQADRPRPPQPETNNPVPNAPSQPFQAPPPPANRERPARPVEREQPAAQPNRPAPAPARDQNAERAHEERRAARLQEQQQQAQQQQQQQAAERARAERPAQQQPAERPRVPQNQEREQRRAERSQPPEPQQAPRPAPEARRAAPETPRPQPQPQPGQNPNEERKHKRDGQPD